MKCIKSQLFGLIVLLTGFESQAQLKFPVTDNDLRNNLVKIIEDFPNNFSSTRGDTIEVNAQTIEFASLLDFKMAPKNSITQYISSKPVFSWQALFLQTEEFEEASKKYKWLCNQLKVMTIKTGTGYSYNLSGNYEEPTISKKFSSSIYKLTPNAADMPKLKIEAAMQYEFPEWKVKLIVYEREREDIERGEINGD
jgi:hypothetical protein